MTRRQTREQLLVRNEIVAAPVKARLRRSELSKFRLAIYIAMATMFASFIAVLGLSFRGGHMAVVYGVIFAFIAAFFAVPAFSRGRPPRKSERRRSACLNLANAE